MLATRPNLGSQSVPGRAAAAVAVAVHTFIRTRSGQGLRIRFPGGEGGYMASREDRRHTSVPFLLCSPPSSPPSQKLGPVRPGQQQPSKTGTGWHDSTHNGAKRRVAVSVKRQPIDPWQEFLGAKAGKDPSAAAPTNHHIVEYTGGIVSVARALGTLRT